MSRRIKASDAEELARLAKKKKRRGLGPIDGACYRRLKKRVNRGLKEVVKDIRREDP